MNTLWNPPADRVADSNMQKFLAQLSLTTGYKFSAYPELHKWSVENPSEFWGQIWKFVDVKHSVAYSSVVKGIHSFDDVQWFEGARLNFAENLLRRRDEHTAIVSCLEDGSRTEISYRELYQRVANLAAALRRIDIEPGDRIAGFMPNVADTVIAMLAAASVGAVWSSCSPDFGFNGVMDRFGQIQPKILFACEAYSYNGKLIDCMPKVAELAKGIDSLHKVVIVPLVGASVDLSAIENGCTLGDFAVPEGVPDIEFEQLPFDHPLYIMYSSGTTGKPKCIVHGAGGTLIQHLKEHRLHVGLKQDDVFFYFTTCGWMMWNWLVSGLASGVTLILYDGSPFYPSPTAMLDLAEQETISIFGTSAKYLAAIEKNHLVPKETHDLSNLKTILSTGSPLSNESFKYVYRSIKDDVCLSSICGGTDILSAFVSGNECLPVIEGELQCIGLGMAIEFWNDEGDTLVGKKGEMVCTKPFPCAPIGFWSDPDGRKYHSAYFSAYSNTWAQGDFGEISEEGGVVIYGRSDAVLNPGGVRIGTAEIYRQVEKLDEVIESICIGQQWIDDVRVILFVVTRPEIELDDDLKFKIKDTIRRNTTPRHVPAVIVSVSDIPKTLSGKIVELAVRDIVHGMEVKNTEALANPEALELFKKIPELC